MLYNGQSGGAIKDGPIGICHAELDAVLTDSRKCRVIKLPLAAFPKEKAQRGRDEAFRTYVDGLALFSPSASSGEELIERVRRS